MNRKKNRMNEEKKIKRKNKRVRKKERKEGGNKFRMFPINFLLALVNQENMD